MTEEQWLTGDDPTLMLEFLRGKASRRKQLLYACGCVRQMCQATLDGPTCNRVGAVEQFADGAGQLEGSPAAVVEIRSETVGTFLGQPAPEAPPFVTVGSLVNPDTVVGLIEALMDFTEITADGSGVIAEVLANTFDPVEYGMTLFRV